MQLHRIIIEVSGAAFSTTSLTKADAVEATRNLWDAHANRIRGECTEEMKAKTIMLNGKAMRFEYRVFGAKPKAGRSLCSVWDAIAAWWAYSAWAIKLAA